MRQQFRQSIGDDMIVGVGITRDEQCLAGVETWVQRDPSPPRTQLQQQCWQSIGDDVIAGGGSKRDREDTSSSDESEDRSMAGEQQPQQQKHVPSQAEGMSMNITVLTAERLIDVLQVAEKRKVMFVVLQETRHPPDGYGWASRIAKQAGWRIQWSDASPLEDGSLRRRTGGCALLWRRELGKRYQGRLLLAQGGFTYLCYYWRHWFLWGCSVAGC